jgi:hypothetical protein
LRRSHACNVGGRKGGRRREEARSQFTTLGQEELGRPEVQGWQFAWFDKALDVCFGPGPVDAFDGAGELLLAPGVRGGQGCACPRSLLREGRREPVVVDRDAPRRIPDEIVPVATLRFSKASSRAPSLFTQQTASRRVKMPLAANGPDMEIRPTLAMT